MTREDEIRKRLERIEADPGQGGPIRLVYPIDESASDLRYLLEKVAYLEGEVDRMAPKERVYDELVTMSPRDLATCAGLVCALSESGEPGKEALANLCANYQKKEPTA